MKWDRLLTLWKKQRLEGCTFDSIAGQYPDIITRAHVYHWLQTEREPDKPELRVALGLPPMKPAPVCVSCGQVHVTKRCTSKIRRVTSLWAMDPAQLRWCLDNREEVGGHV